MQPREHEETANAISDEIDCVFCVHHAFPEPVSAEFGKRCDDFIIGVLAGHKLEQMHHLDGVKEVSDGDVRTKTSRHSFRYLRQRDTRRVGRDHRAIFSNQFQSGEKFSLGFEVFDDGLTNPVVV